MNASLLQESLGLPCILIPVSDVVVRIKSCCICKQSTIDIFVVRACMQALWPSIDVDRLMLASAMGRFGAQLIQARVVRFGVRLMG